MNNELVNLSYMPKLKPLTKWKSQMVKNEDDKHLMNKKVLLKLDMSF
jgi:hypothetical protein